MAVHDGRPDTRDQLSERELTVLRLMAEGLSNQEIADRLVLALTTVKWYVRQIFQKLGTRRRREALAVAQRQGLLPDGLAVPDALLAQAMPVGENPYKGLRAFQEADATDFYGREALVLRLLARLDDNGAARFLALVGPSGSGKSSVVRAGLIPALRRGALPGAERWLTVEMYPGAHPLEELEAGLLRAAVNPPDSLLGQLRDDERGLVRAVKRVLPADETELLLVIDQFEEVFTLVEQASVRAHFLDSLRAAAMDPRSRLRIVLTLRADFYDRPLQYRPFGELLCQHTEVVLPLSPDELEQAIVRPAQQAGVSVEPGLVAAMVAEVNEQPGALPLLEYALTELYEWRQGRVMTLRSYERIGRTLGALTRQADELYDDLSDEEPDLARQLFLRLVTLGEGTEDVRRRTLRAELTALGDRPGLVDDLLDAFGQYRLLVFDRDPVTRAPTVELAHEAILREWRRLRAWLDESRAEIRLQRQLGQAAQDWERAGREASYLLGGTRLAQYEEWAGATTLALTPAERAYVDASLTQRANEQTAEAERQAHEQRLQRRSRRLHRALVVVLALATLGAFGLTGFAFSQRAQAQAARMNAERSAGEFRSIALSFGAEAALDNGQPDVALALAREAVQTDNPPPQVHQTFLTAATSSWIQERFQVSNTRVWDAVYHPDGKRIITTSWDGRAEVWDIETGQEKQAIQRDGFPLHVSIHPDGNLAVVGGRDGHLQFWNLATNEVTDFLDGEVNQMSPTFTRDGSLMLTSSHDGRINIWDMQTIRIIRSFEAHDARIQSIQFNTDESLLMTGGEDGRVKIWDFQTGELVQTLVFPGSVSRDIPAGEAWVWEAQFLPDGNRVLSVDGNGVIILWDWRSGEIIRLVEADAQVHDLALSPNGQTFLAVIGDPDSHVKLIDVETGNIIRVYRGHSQRTNNIDLSPDGTHFVTASLDGTAAIWPVTWEGTQMTALVPAGRDLAWHPARPLVAVIGGSTENHGIIRLVNTQNGVVEQEFAGPGTGILSLAFTPDGRYLLAGANIEVEGYPVLVWDIETGEQVSVLAGENAALDLAVSPDNRFVAGGGWEGARVALWDLETSERVYVLDEHRDWVTGLVFSPDGRSLYSSARDGTLFQWHVQTGEMAAQFSEGPVAIWDIDLNSDGTRLVSAMEDHTAVIWDTATGEALITLRGHSAALENADFSPDDRFIMSSALNGRIILWDAQTGERLRVYVGSIDTANPQDFRAHFSPDGHSIASGANNVLAVWDASPWGVDLDTWVTENRYVPEFTCEQRELYRIEPLCGAGGQAE
jgi:WD40 repeat protein/DNA-binding CsgD family transcriptional regulator